ncbi:hypothetical protein V6N12_046060 [Hibiscus sabdariffa]|uniref:Uncharacterized protein n=1 Tax=Hibiscus sabdariffa TaxID=183260 RepID=A0ABR2G4S9_9ROSI
MKVCLMGFVEGCAWFRGPELCLVLTVGGSDGVKNGEVLVRGCCGLTRGLVQWPWCSMKDGIAVGRWCSDASARVIPYGLL